MRFCSSMRLTFSLNHGRSRPDPWIAMQWFLVSCLRRSDSTNGPVFLKILEYYEGILLLTTNRVKSIDIAVESRISLSIHFGPMSKIDQRRLFKIFLDRLDERDIESKEDLETFGEKYFKEVCEIPSEWTPLSAALTGERTSTAEISATCFHLRLLLPEQRIRSSLDGTSTSSANLKRAHRRHLRSKEPLRGPKRGLNSGGLVYIE